jgi:hypothetical protein
MNENVDCESIDHQYANIAAKNIEVIEVEHAPNDTKPATSDGNGRAVGNVTAEDNSHNQSTLLELQRT